MIMDHVRHTKGKVCARTTCPLLPSAKSMLSLPFLFSPATVPGYQCLSVHLAITDEPISGMGVLPQPLLPVVVSSPISGEGRTVVGLLDVVVFELLVLEVVGLQVSEV